MFNELPAAKLGTTLYGISTLSRDNGHGGIVRTQVVDLNRPLGRLELGNRVRITNILETNGGKFGIFSELSGTIRF